jgi:hypothetical protein
MRGISERELQIELSQLEGHGNAGEKAMLLHLINRCEELNPWLQIDENSPKDRPLWLFNGVKVIGQWDDCLCEWSVLPVFWNGQTFDTSKPFTHYQELPGDPV